MGLLDKIFGRQKQQKPVIEKTYKIKLSDINDLLSMNIEEKFNEHLKNCDCEHHKNILVCG